MTAHEWRPIPGFPDYLASSLGEIASTKSGRIRILEGGRSEMGYRNVLLYQDGHRVGRRVHQLVALTFLGPRPPGLEIRHLDGDKLNNVASNLRYGTREENLADQRRHRGLLLIVGPDPLRRVPTPRHKGTHCRYGHERTPENTYIRSDGKACCRPCKSRYEMESRRRRLAREKAA